MVRSAAGANVHRSFAGVIDLSCAEAPVRASPCPSSVGRPSRGRQMTARLDAAAAAAAVCRGARPAGY